MKFFDFKFLSKIFHKLTPLNSNFFCLGYSNMRGKKKLDELGFLVLCECIFSILVNLSWNKKKSYISCINLASSKLLMHKFSKF